jgi:signal-transduction protein with cAMP-binding, CBS, and nucleotidyltransferase domain
LKALAVMMENNVRHLPIECEAGKFCQMLSLKDVITALRKTVEKQILNFLLAMAEDDLDNVIPMHR